MAQKPYVETADFAFSCHGSVTTVYSVSDAAKEFAEENFEVEGWQGVPTSFTTDTRVAAALKDQLESEGWNIKG